MTIFYVFLYHVWRQRYQISRQKGLSIAVYGLVSIRIILTVHWHLDATYLWTVLIGYFAMKKECK